MAFTLHDTHGFPVELTEELARDAGVEVDRAGFDAAMAEQRERARAAAKSVAGRRRGGLPGAARRRGADGVRRAGPGELRGAGPGGGRARGRGDAGRRRDERRRPASVEIFLDRTPFYAESGGQVGDTGTIVTESGIADVYDTVSTPCRAWWRTGRALERRGAGRAGRAGHDRRRAPGGHPAQPHRDAPAARGAARRCWATTCASRARWWRPTTCASTSRTTRSRPARSSTRSSRGQRRRADRRRRRDDRDVARGGREHGRHRLLRRQVRRVGARRAGGADLARVLRRHPRRLARPDRPDHAALGGLHRLEHAADLRADRQGVAASGPSSASAWCSRRPSCCAPSPTSWWPPSAA